MRSKIPAFTNITTNEADELRVMVTELNESIAYLSKMVVQLQKSIDSNKDRRGKGQPESENKPKTIH